MARGRTVAFRRNGRAAVCTCCALRDQNATTIIPTCTNGSGKFTTAPSAEKPPTPNSTKGYIVTVTPISLRCSVALPTMALLALVSTACTVSDGDDGGSGTAAGSSSLTGGTSSLGGQSGQTGGRTSTASGGTGASTGGTSASTGGSATGGVAAAGAAWTTGGVPGGEAPSTGGSSAGTGGTSLDGSGGWSSAGGGGPANTGGSAGSEAGEGGTQNDSGGAAGAFDGGTSGLGGSGSADCDATQPPPVGRLGLDVVVEDPSLGALVYAAQPPGSEDWYLVDILGHVWVFTDGALLPTPFLDVSEEVQDLDFSYDERGLLSVAFPPDYETSGRVYVALIPTSGATADHDLVLEYTRSQADPFVVDPASRREILDLPPRGEDPALGPVDLNLFHNASTVMFGPDGMLYVGMGDGGGQCNSANPGVPQDITVPYGKILRLDPSAPAPHGAPGNPFAEDGDPRVLHYGLRNPYRFSFDSLTGDLYIGDVGQWDFEEISFAPSDSPALNFGWPDFEGTAGDTCPGATSLRPGSTHTPPIHTISHGADAGAADLVVAVVGGTVYRGSAIPELYGAYLFGEYYAGRDMGALYQCGDVTSDVVRIRKSCDANFPNDPCFLPQGGAPALGEVGAVIVGSDGELYLPANNNALLKIVPVP